MSTHVTPEHSPEPGAEHCLLALARAFEIAQAQLNMVGEMSEAMAVCPNRGTDQHLYFQDVCERLTTRQLCAMLSISDAASRIPARTPAELSAKATIWLGRFIPEPDNDVLALAESICRDIAASPDARTVR